MPPPCRPPSPLRLAQALTSGLALATGASAGPWLPGEGEGCLAAWGLSFGLTLLLLAAETRAPPRRDLPFLHAVAAAAACAAAAVIWPLGHLRGGETTTMAGGGETSRRALRVVAAVASCAAAISYGAEAWRDRARPGETAPYLTTPSGGLKILETFLALLLLGLAAEQGAGSGPVAWRWCLGIYCVAFVLGVTVIGAMKIQIVKLSTVQIL